MGDPISTAIIISAIVGAGTQAVGARQAEREAEKAGKRQAAETQRLTAEIAQRGAAEEEQATAEAARATARQRQRALAAGGRRGTLLTGPLGITEGFETGPKTLLGL
jgi:hypothetical protein